MKLTVAGRNIKVTQAIEDHLNSKFEQNMKDWLDNSDIHVALSVEKHRHFAEVTFKTKGFTAHGEHETDDLYIAMDHALDKIEKQLRKRKTRSKRLQIKKVAKSKDDLSE